MVLALLLAASAFFSASETAYSCMNRIRVRHLAEDGNEKAALALRVADKFDRMISAILIGNNVVNLSASSIATVMATVLLGASGAAVSTIVMTVLVLAFGEVLPKSYAKEHSDALVLKFAYPLHIIMVVLTPLTWLFTKLQRLAKPKNAGDEPSVTEQELKSIIQNSEEEGVLDEQESDIIQSALDFNDTTVQEILIPRVDMVAVDVEDDLDEILERAASLGFSRLPVYENSIDNIIGVLHGKDLLRAFVRREEIRVRELVRECLYVYRTKKISDLLGEFKQQKVHIAIVTDEYGGTLGLVTMEDILEELVGDIWDESDVVKHELVWLSEDTCTVAGDLNIEDFFDDIGFQYKNFESDYSTVGGWALENLGHIPQVGESFSCEKLRLTVTAMEEQRVVRLLAELCVPAPADGVQEQAVEPAPRA